MTTQELINLLNNLDPNQQLGVYINKSDGKILPCANVYIHKNTEFEYIIIE